MQGKGFEPLPSSELELTSKNFLFFPFRITVLIIIKPPKGFGRKVLFTTLKISKNSLKNPIIEIFI